MKVIFLDIDGVLNYQYMHTNTHDEIIGTFGGKLSRKCITQLNELVDKTDAKIVISSTWRVDDGVEGYLVDAGVKADIIGKTPVLNDRFSLRGNEIHAWIVENEALIGEPYHNYHSFVILDDDSDMLLWHRENYFQTDTYTGLTPNIVYRAERFLNRYS